MAHEEDDDPSIDIIRRFKEDDAVDQGVMPLQTLSVLWFLEENGEPNMVWKFEGYQRPAIVIGDLEFIKNDILNPRCTCDPDAHNPD